MGYLGEPSQAAIFCLQLPSWFITLMGRTVLLLFAAAALVARAQVKLPDTSDLTTTVIKAGVYMPFSNIDGSLREWGKWRDVALAIAVAADDFNARDPRVVQVSASMVGERRHIEILRGDGRRVTDIRPLVRLNVSITVEKDGRRERASSGAGGRAGFATWIAPERWQGQVDEALRQALVNLEAVDCPAGEMDVVLGAGWPGVLLHEAIGHGFEGDFHRKGSSVFTGMMGQRVAAPGVTVVVPSPVFVMFNESPTP